MTTTSICSAQRSQTPGPDAVDADELITQLDHAGIQRTVVLSLAYAYGRPPLSGPDEYDRVKAENDWTAAQAARYPHRLRAFCSVNPLREYALEEIDRCASLPGLRRSLKPHLANSDVSFRRPEHVRQLRRVFDAANARGMPIMVHVWKGNQEIGNPYRGEDARTFVEAILPSAPDVPIQIAHLGGSGPVLDDGTREAMMVLADARVTRHSATRNLYFDITTNVAARSSRPDAEFITALIRRIGPEFILYGSDLAVGGNATARESWNLHRSKLLLTDTDITSIASNVAPYGRW